MIHFVSNPHFLQKFIFWGEVAGAVVSFVGFVTLIYKWFKAVTETNRNVNLVMTNHLPHLATSLESHGAALEGIRRDVVALDTNVKGLDQRIDDTKKAVTTLGAMFVTHLENTSAEVAKKKSVKKVIRAI